MCHCRLNRDVDLGVEGNHCSNRDRICVRSIVRLLIGQTHETMTSLKLVKILVLCARFLTTVAQSTQECYIPPDHSNGEVIAMDPHGALSGQICKVNDTFVQIHYQECMPFFCCADPCVCGTQYAMESANCHGGPAPAKISCFTIHAVPQYILYKCCPGWVEIGNTTICVPESNCAVNNGGCNTASSTCEPSVNNTGVCQCLPGYTPLDNKNCIPIDYCDNNNGGCVQHCHSTLGSRYCTCDAGYQLAADMMNCTIITSGGVDTNTIIYIAIGSIFGLLLLCLLPLLLLLLYFCRRRRKQPPPPSPVVAAFENRIYETNPPIIVVPAPPPPYEDPIKDKKGLPPMNNVTEVADEELGACSKPPPAYDSIDHLPEKDDCFYEKSDCSYKKKGKKGRPKLESQTSQTELIDDYNNQCDTIENEKNVYAENDDIDAKLEKKFSDMN